MKFVNPKNDIAFRRIFGNENKKEILISFLNAVLGLTGDRQIKEIEILNPYQAPKLESLKYTILDIRAKDKREVTFIIEMQVENVAGYKKRFLYYTSKAYSSQIERGEDYPRLNQVIFIGILDFSAFESKDYITKHLILNNKTYKQEIEDLEFNFIELPKFKKLEKEVESLVDKWIYFIKNAADLDVIPVNADFQEIREAYEEANKLNWTKEELEVYDYWSMRAQDERGSIELALTRGREEGRREGKEEGRKEAVKKMYSKGLGIEQIADLLEIDMDKIKAIVDKIK
jgi:predicted transposase/invertase (TIGR01784 family)